MQGFINVFKPINMTSAKVVAKIKHSFNLKKVGHMGTLDPLACGILPIAVGKATKMFDYFLNKKKTYETVIKFGVTTNTLDLDGEIIKTTSVIPEEKDVINILPTFIGKQFQTPPIFSAKNINGQKAYKMARNGEDFILEKKEIEIFAFDLISKIDDSSYKFRICCSSGTYIRSIAKDIGEKLNSCAMITYLERTESEHFTKNNCISLELLLKSNIQNYLIDIENVFNNYEIINVNENDFFKLKNGLIINLETKNSEFFIKFNNKLLGVGIKTEEGTKIKTYLLEE